MGEGIDASFGISQWSEEDLTFDETESSRHLRGVAESNHFAEPTWSLVLESALCVRPPWDGCRERRVGQILRWGPSLLERPDAISLSHRLMPGHHR